MEINFGGVKKPQETSIFFEKTQNPSKTSEFGRVLSLYEKGITTSVNPDLDKAIYQDIIPHPTNTPWDLYTLVYEKSSLVYNSVNNTADFAIQGGFDIDASEDAKKKILGWMDDVNYELILANIFKHLQIYGNAYLDVTDIKFPKLLHPKTMFVRAQKGGNEDGKLIGYKQILGPNTKIDFELDEIVHFKYNDTTNSFYGMSELKPVLGPLTRYANWTEDLGEILHRFAAPYLHHKVGTDEAPATQQQVDDYTGKLNTRMTGEDWVTSGAVDIVPIVATQGMIQMDGLVRGLQDEIIAGLRTCEIFVRGGVNANKNVGEIELQAFDRKVRALQKTVSMIEEDVLFPKITNGKAKHIWNEFSVEGEKVRAERLKLMVGAGMPLKTAMNMIGWGTWIDDMAKDREEEDARNAELMKQETDLNTNSQVTINKTKPIKQEKE